MKKFSYYFLNTFVFVIIVGAFGLLSHTAQGQDPSAKPVQFILSCTIPSGQLVCSNNVKTPSGKRLTVEFVSAKASISSNQSPQLRIFTPSFDLANPGGTINLGHYITLNLSPRIPGSADRYYASQQVRLYIMEGGTITIEGRRYDTASGSATFEVTFSGYMIDVP
jgi:hypothetical protein